MLECEYQIIKLAKPLCGFIGFTPYNNVFEVLKTAVTEPNRLPKCMIESSYPMLGGFLSAVRYGSPANEINLALQQNFDVIQKIFFDQTKVASLSILRTRLNGITIDDADLLGIFNSVNSGFDLDETTFMDALYMKIEEYTKRSIVFKIKNEWIRISGTQTPDEWAMDNRIPARFAFGNHYSSSDLLRAINQPEELSAAKLDEILEMLKDVKTAKVEDCQKAFLADVIPNKYKKFEIGLAPILEYLCKKCGNQPNKWHFPVDIEEFIKSQYKVSIAPQIKEKLRTSDAEALKKRLVQLAGENPELGLLFLED